MKVLVVVDMQNDFVSGSLASSEAKLIVDNVVNKIKNFDGKVLYTKDTHGDDYLETMEGKKLPVKHCIKDTWGWEIIDEIKPLIEGGVIEKPTFGSEKLIEELKKIENIESVEIVGLCTDICVISNALLIKASFPEVKIVVDASCCAGVSVESHTNALNAMKVCHIDIINEA
ncbi:MAG: isochorismatase family cysteine hydrolase [Bacillota bacterium]|jgi:nicotinamidase-related amidase|nr:isochorismatase family cysteine hydrolase [Bacillota bacterium]NLP22487.1 cysteine hydrolase [Erysipelotrichaceae bacterium]